ncbi:MAG: hypothetical protein HFP77_01255 [Methylococcales symbiont of Iophon sp. n. MRB-2018]|nr:MAG: hypothetical protein HFP77_01255 [Methylococcales symbiont of Iophon sp. n. MRB-2018]KAF3980550.1 MAG: hypothetical protein HFP76_01475 [Methylococcales symbiont of Iophon sp. n. MRB-2018]
MAKNIFLFALRLLWNIIVTGFVLWFGFIFGPELFLLSLLLTPMYIKMWNKLRKQLLRKMALVI